MEATLRHLARIVLDPGFAENTSMAKSVFNEDLVRALLGLREPTWSSSMDPSSGLKFLDETLNDSQKEAVSFALRADQVACIHGPPGVSPSLGFRRGSSCTPDATVSFARPAKRLRSWRSFDNSCRLANASWSAEPVTWRSTTCWQGCLYMCRRLCCVWDTLRVFRPT